MADKTVVVRLTVRAGEYVRGMQQAGAAANQFSVQAEQGAKRAAGATKGLGIASMVSGKAILLGIGGAMAVSAQAAIEFESALTSVAKTTNLSGPGLTAMADALRNLALTRVPVNVNQLGELAAIGGQLGIETPNIVAFTEVIAKLGVTTNIAGEDAAVGLARLSNVMGTPQNEIENLASSIVELGNNFATTESEILTFAMRLAPVATTIGLTEGATLGLATAMSSLGIPAERGGTALQRVFIDMKKAVDNGGESMERFGKVAGMSGEQFGEMFKNDPGQAFAMFVAGLDSIAKSGENVFVALENVGIREQRTIQALLAAAEGHEIVAEAMNMGADAYEENIALNEEAALRFGTTASQIEFLKNSFNDLRIEIGSMVLGSGGLQTAMDVIIEFFDILKNNTGTISNFVKVLAGLAVAQLAKGFGTLASNIGAGIIQFEKGRKGLQGMSIMARTTAISMGALNAAMNLTVGVAGILLTVWAMQAIKAAELRQAVRALNEEIEAGVDPVDAFMAAMEQDGGALSTKNKDILNDLGVSVRDYAEAILEGASAEEALLGLVGGKPIKNAEDMAAALDVLNEKMAEAGRGNEANKFFRTSDYRGFIDDMNGAGDVADEFSETLRANVKSALVEAQVGVNMTSEAMNDLVDNIIRVNGLDVTPEQAVAWGQAWSGSLGEGRKQARAMASEFPRDMEAVDKSFQDVIMGMEDGGDILEGFFDTAADAGTTFSEDVGGALDDVSNQLRSGIPGWEEYESGITVSMGKVRESFRKYIQDLEAWVGAQDTVMATASESTRAWLEGQGPAIQGYLGSLPEDELVAFITDMNGSFEQIAVQQEELLGTRLPGIVNTHLPALLQSITAAVEGMGLDDELSMEAFNTAIASVLGTLTPDQMALVQSQINAAMGTVDWYTVGNTPGIEIKNGFVVGLSAMTSEASRIAGETAAALSGTLYNDMRIKSPSRVTYEIGGQAAAGFVGGWKDGMAPMNQYTTPQALIPNNYTNNNGSTTNNNNRALNITLPITAADSDLRREVEKGAVYMGSIVSLVEAGAGK